MWRRVPERRSQTMGVVEGGVPHSSGVAPFSGRCTLSQQEVTMDPSRLDSTRNLLMISVSGKLSGGTRSQGRRIKSRCIRDAKFLSTVQVPLARSWDPSKGKTSTRSDG